MWAAIIATTNCLTMYVHVVYCWLKLEPQRRDIICVIYVRVYVRWSVGLAGPNALSYGPLLAVVEAAVYQLCR